MLGHSFGNITKGQSREFPVYLNAINFVWSINIVNDFISTKWILTFMESHIDLFSLTHYWRVHFISMGRVHSTHPSSIVNYNFISIELFIIPRVVYVSLRVAESCCLCPCIFWRENWAYCEEHCSKIELVTIECTRVVVNVLSVYVYGN